MSELKEIFTLSIDLTKIDKSKIKEITLKNSNIAKFLDLTMYVNTEQDQYNNIGSVCLGQSKEEREAKAPKVYIGNSKRQWTSSTASDSKPTTNQMGLTQDETDDLPF